MTTFLLVHHADHDHRERLLAGRMPHLHLNDEGRRQARTLAKALAPLVPEALYSSPRDCCRETALPLSERTGREIAVEGCFDEVDYGDWTGCRLSDLHHDPAWRRWEGDRHSNRPPRGEPLTSVRTRFSGGLARLEERHPGGIVIVFSHADAIKTVVLPSLGLPFHARVDWRLDPARVTVLHGRGGRYELSFLNAEPFMLAAVAALPSLSL